jgi:hypothetical protein
VAAGGNLLPAAPQANQAVAQQQSIFSAINQALQGLNSNAAGGSGPPAADGLDLAALMRIAEAPVAPARPAKKLAVPEWVKNFVNFELVRVPSTQHGQSLSCACYRNSELRVSEVRVSFKE